MSWVLNASWQEFHKLARRKGAPGTGSAEQEGRKLCACTGLCGRCLRERQHRFVGALAGPLRSWGPWEPRETSRACDVPEGKFQAQEANRDAENPVSLHCLVWTALFGSHPPLRVQRPGARAQAALPCPPPRVRHRPSLSCCLGEAGVLSPAPLPSAPAIFYQPLKCGPPDGYASDS